MGWREVPHSSWKVPVQATYQVITPAAELIGPRNGALHSVAFKSALGLKSALKILILVCTFQYVIQYP